MKENLLLRVLMLECVNRERRDSVEKELRVKLKKYNDGYSQSQKLLETLQKENESWANKLDIAETKANKSTTKEESQGTSLEDALCSNKKL